MPADRASTALVRRFSIAENLMLRDSGRAPYARRGLLSASGRYAKALELMRADGMSGEQIKRSTAYRGFGIRDGNGIMFVSNTGDICPAGFLPLTAGNVRRDRIADIYRNSPVFMALHDPEQFHGRCGDCEYHALCGGSRARAYEATGDPLGEDPFCIYVPHEVTRSAEPLPAQ